MSEQNHCRILASSRLKFSVLMPKQNNMSEKQTKGESVLFAFIHNRQILCEWREWQGNYQFSIPGGKIEPVDRQQTNYQQAALIREVWEELQVMPTKFARIGETWYKEAQWRFHVYLISAWDGEIPSEIMDSRRPLGWVAPADLEDNIAMIGISTLIREHIKIKQR